MFNSYSSPSNGCLQFGTEISNLPFDLATNYYVDVCGVEQCTYLN